MQGKFSGFILQRENQNSKNLVCQTKVPFFLLTFTLTFWPGHLGYLAVGSSCQNQIRVAQLGCIECHSDSEPAFTSCPNCEGEMSCSYKGIIMNVIAELCMCVSCCQESWTRANCAVVCRRKHICHIIPELSELQSHDDRQHVLMLAMSGGTWQTRLLSTDKCAILIPSLLQCLQLCD